MIPYASKCLLCVKEKTINHTGRKYSKIIQKVYKNKHDSVENAINWELCKTLNFDNTITWYMHKPECIQENEMYKILWDFEIKMDHLILARRPDNLKKKNLPPKIRSCHHIHIDVHLSTGVPSIWHIRTQYQCRPTFHLQHIPEIPSNRVCEAQTILNHIPANPMAEQSSQ